MLHLQGDLTRSQNIQSALQLLKDAPPTTQQTFFSKLENLLINTQNPSSNSTITPNLEVSTDLRSSAPSSVKLTEITQVLHTIASQLSIDPKVRNDMNQVFSNAADARKQLATLTPDQKVKGLTRMATQLRSQSSLILAANESDVTIAKSQGIESAALDRLELNEQKVAAMADALDAIAAQEDPINKTLETFYPPNNGLKIDKISKPLGVIGIIYEARPNVTSDAAGIGLKSSNPVILRPGSNCYETSKAIVVALQKGMQEAGIHEHAVQLVPTKNRDAVGLMLKARGKIDLVIPRGGKSLTQRVYDEALVPTLLHLDGNCHTYIDEHADEAKAIKVVTNAKMRRTGICGATESLVIHKNRVDDLLPKIVASLKLNGCELVGDDRAVAAIPESIAPADADDFQTEFLGPKLSIQVVDSTKEAIEIINKNSSKHTEAIISENQDTQNLFLNSIASAITMVNTSTQFADGGEFGFGAEIGIATGSQAPRGPVGAQHLTSFAYQVYSDGAIRPGGNDIQPQGLPNNL